MIFSKEEKKKLYIKSTSLLIFQLMNKETCIYSIHIKACLVLSYQL